jgi:hypothetical protein
VGDLVARFHAVWAGLVAFCDTAATATKTNSTGLQPDNFRVAPATGAALIDSIGANSGTFVGSPLFNVPGAVAGGFNTGVRWDGSGTYASVPDANTLDLGDGAPFTLEAWVRRHDAASGRQTILDKGSGSFQVDVTGAVTDHPLTSNTSPLYFARKGGSSEYLNASQDEVAAYNVVLSAATIREHCRNGQAA